MAVKKIIDLEVQSNADEAVGSLRTQLRLAQQEVAALSEKFGATSKEAVQAAKRAAELKDAIGDAKALSDAFNPDAKFKALSASLSGVAGGFAAVQGAMGLFGTESEEVEKALLKVQSAMALSQGLQAVGESVDSFKQLSAVIGNANVFQKANNFLTATAATVQRLFTGAVNTTTLSFNALKTAIATTGIGALVVGLGYLVSALSSASDETEELSKQQKKLNQDLEDNKEITSELSKSVQYQTDLEVASAKKRGASEKELLKIKLESYERIAKLNAKEYEEIYKTSERGTKLTEEQAKRLAEIRKENIELQRKGNLDIANFEADQAEKRRDKEKDSADKLKELRKEADKQRLEDKKKNDEEYKKIVEQKNAELQDYYAKTEEEKIAIQKQRELDEINAFKGTQEQKDSIRRLYDEKWQNYETDKETERNNLALERQRQYNELYIQQIISANDRIMEADLKMKEARRFALDSSLELLSSFAGRNKTLALGILAIQKGLAVADVIVNASKSIATQNANTFAANMVARATLGPVAGEVAATKNTIALVKGVTATKITAGVAIANILAQGITSAKGMLGGGGEGGGGAIGGGGAAPSQPQFNVVGNTGVNALADSLNKQPIQAYVVAQNVTSAQSMNRNIVQSATLG